MKVKFLKFKSMVLLFACSIVAFAVHSARAQAVPQITQMVDESNRTTLTNNVYPLAKAIYDQGAVADSTPTGSLILTLKRSPSQENALQQFLLEAHTKGTANYHKWLTPAQFGQQYGPADSDMATVESWLQSHGFTIEKVGAGKTAIVFSGTAGQVKSAFGTTLHTYNVNGELHHSNSTNPQIPTALTPVIAAVGTLNDFHPKSLMKMMGTASYNPTTHLTTPQWTYPNGAGGLSYVFGPKDFATQYDVTPLYKAGINGSGQTIGILNESNIDLGLVSAYRKLFGLDANPAAPNLPHIIIDGQDPGVTSAASEAYLDVEVSGAIAPNATVNLYIAANTDYNDGLDLAMLRAVEDDTAPVLSLSFGGCEAYEGVGYMTYINSLWEQAAAQGQTVMVATGDSGAAVCDDGNDVAFFGLQVNGLASSPWDIAVGGTDFYYADGAASIASNWNAQNDIDLGSLIAPIPEQPWNDSVFGLNVLVDADVQIAGSSGGQSTCAVAGGPLEGTNALTSSGYCTGLGGFPKPEWQYAPGVPNDQVRDQPDIALFAANGANLSYVPICASPGDCVNIDPSTGAVVFSGVGGTSVSAPSFAAIMALVNQKYGPQGQANFVLYPLAMQKPSIFHDITVGSNNVPCDFNNGLQCYPPPANITLPICGCLVGSLQNWYAGPGYDLASGLGSVDVNALVANWNSVTTIPTTTELSASAATITHGQPVTFATSVAAGSGSGTPTGSVAIIADTTLPANSGQTPISLDKGSGSIVVDSLPGGTYNVYGRYGGDGTYGSSQSSPVSITVTPESSVIQASAFQDQTSPYPPITPLGPSVNYGTIVGIDLQINGASAPANTVPGTPTGTTTFIDNGKSIATLPLNSNGASVYSTATWTVGQHSLTFSYSGDPSFNPTTTTTPAAPITFTVLQGQPTITVSTSAASILIGGSVVVQAAVESGPGGGLAPSGNVIFTLGSQTWTVALSPGINPNGPVQGIASAVFPNVPAGTFTPSVSYAGDTNWAAATATGTPVVVSGTSLLANSTTAMVLTSPSSLAAIQPGTLITFTATVAGPSGSTVAPTGTVQFVTGGYLFGPNSGAAVALQPGFNGTSSVAFSFTAVESLAGENQIYGIYSGDANYNSSVSTVLAYNSSAGDFSILNNNPTITVKSGSAGSANLTFSSINQFSGNVTLSCVVTGSGTPVPQCSVPATAAITATGQTAVAVQFVTSFPAGSSLFASHSHGGLWTASGGTALACIFLLGVPARRRKWQVMFGLLLFATFSGAVIGCAANSKPAPVSLLVPAGTYTAVITGTNGITTHNVPVTIVVQ